MRLPFVSAASPASVRALHTADAGAASSIHAEGFARPWDAAEIERLLVDAAVVGQGVGPASGVLHGFVLSRVAADEAEVLTIAVARRHRGGGLAGRLLLAHLGRLAAAGARAVFLEVDEANAPARALYARHGFAEVGRRTGYYRRPDGTATTALVLRRDLP